MYANTSFPSAGKINRTNNCPSLFINDAVIRLERRRNTIFMLEAGNYRAHRKSQDHDERPRERCILNGVDLEPETDL